MRRQGLGDPTASNLIQPVDGVGVDPQQHRDTVTRPAATRSCRCGSRRADRPHRSRTCRHARAVPRRALEPRAAGESLPEHGACARVLRRVNGRRSNPPRWIDRIPTARCLSQPAAGGLRLRAQGWQRRPDAPRRSTVRHDSKLRRGTVDAPALVLALCRIGLLRKSSRACGAAPARARASALWRRRAAPAVVPESTVADWDCPRRTASRAAAMNRRGQC